MKAVPQGVIRYSLLMRLGMLLIAGAALGNSASARAAVIFYSDAAAFAAAAGTLTTIDFEGVVANDGTDSASSHTFSGVTFQPLGVNGSIICGAAFGCGGAPYDSATYVSNFGYALDIDLPSGVVAAGGFFGDLDGPGFNATFTVFNGASVLDTHTEFLNDFGAGRTHDFLGWIATGGDVISRINVENSFVVWIAADNFSISAAASVPEPTTLALLGLAGIGFRRRKRGV